MYTYKNLLRPSRFHVRSDYLTIGWLRVEVPVVQGVEVSANTCHSARARIETAKARIEAAKARI